nr:polymeric immunoglobulin receptor-like [Paramormyrops kingsleyae]
MLGGDSVRTFGYLTAQSGESLTIPCFYDQKYKDHVKYWCTGQLWSSCTIMTRTDSPKNSSKVSITDSPAQLVFHVIMRNLKTSDTGIYWCAVEIGGIGEMDDSKNLLIEVKGFTDNGLKKKNHPVSGGSLDKNDLLMAELVNNDFHDVPVGADSVRTFRHLTTESGESLTIPCFYDQKYKDHVKYWCKGQLWSSCTIMARTDSPQSSRKVSITDYPAQLVFHVIMRNLKTSSDTAIYWCAVEIGGLGEMDDSQDLVIEVKDAQSVRTVSWVSAERGGSVTIPCYYDQKYKHHVKYWCRGSNWNSCSSLARSDSNQTAGKVSISDDPAHLVFYVIMRNLQENDSDTYWCTVEIHGAADDGVYLQLIVMEVRCSFC